jgi:hypothetical protein
MPRIPDALLECSMFLYHSEEHAREGVPLGGSGFFAQHVTAKGFYLFAVTNRHVALDECCTWMRVATPDGGFDVIDTDERLWIGHPDPSCDVAVYPMAPEGGSFRFCGVPPRMPLREEQLAELDIGPGEEIFLIGRFRNHEGKQKNIPTVRFGNIAQMPDEPILDNRKREQRMFLIDGRSIPGFSGSPVFVYLTKHQGFPRKEIIVDVYSFQDVMGMWGPYLLGINCGHSFRREKISSTQQSEQGPKQFVHTIEVETGLAMVLPAWKITEVMSLVAGMIEADDEDDGAAGDDAPP